MIKINQFVFNPFEVNAYVLSDETNECILIDPACYSTEEKKNLKNYIEKNSLKPIKLINTHCHVDHVLGNSFISDTYGLSAQIHKAGLPLLNNLKAYGLMFGINVEEFSTPHSFIEDQEPVNFGNSFVKAIYIPGHADGSLVFYSEEGFVIVGDVLFRDSIGRTDLPSGNHNLLISNIKNKLMTLPDNTKVYCGHGVDTTIAYEKNNNPYL